MFHPVKKPAVKIMLPDSYDKVSTETRLTVQLFMAHARHLVKKKGLSDDATKNHMDEYQKEAMGHAVDMAVEGWQDDRKSCSAEQFVQWFASLVWKVASGSSEFHSSFPTSDLLLHSPSFGLR